MLNSFTHLALTLALGMAVAALVAAGCALAISEGIRHLRGGQRSAQTLDLGAFTRSVRTR